MGDRQSFDWWVEHLNLVEHPGDEEGFFKEAARDPFQVNGVMNEQRSASTIAYFIQKKSPKMSDSTFLFRCQSTEMIFYHYGAPLAIYIFNQGPNSEPEKVVVGTRLDKGETPAFAIPKNTWFTRLVEDATEDEFCVYSCSLAPGFDLADFESKRRADFKNTE